MMINQCFVSVFCVLSRFIFLRDVFGMSSGCFRDSISPRQILDRSSIGSRSVFVHPSFILRLSFVRCSIRDRRTIEERSKKQHSIIGGSSQDYRSIIGVLLESEPILIRQTFKNNSLLSTLFYRKFLYCQIKCVSLHP